MQRCGPTLVRWVIGAHAHRVRGADRHIGYRLIERDGLARGGVDLDWRGRDGREEKGECCNDAIGCGAGISAKRGGLLASKRTTLLCQIAAPGSGSRSAEVPARQSPASTSPPIAWLSGRMVIGLN